MNAYKEYEHHFPAVLEGVKKEKNVVVLKTRDSFGEALTVELGFFGSGIIRVRTAKGKFTPPIYPVVREEMLEAEDVTVREEEKCLVIEGIQYRIEIGREPWRMRICHTDGSTACEENISDVDSVGDGRDRIPPIGYSVDDGAVKGMNIGFTLHYDENIYGLGEHFTDFNKTGQTVSMMNFDTLGCRDGNAYKNIPFYMSSYGYGLFVHNHGVFDFCVGSESLSTVSAHIPGESLEYYLIIHPSLKEILAAYMKLTGPAALPPKWSFGLWYSTGFKGNSRANAEADAARFRSEGIPCDVMHFDCYWLREDHWCDFVWDEEMYPDRKAMFAGLKKEGYKVCLWINPYVTVVTEMYQEGKQKDCFVKNGQGEPYEADLWHGLLSPCAFLDFTNPEAVEWFKEKIRKTLNEGVDILKTDFGEDIPFDAQFYNGLTGKEMRNVYSRLYNQAVFETVKECRGEENAIVWARSGCAGMQQFPVCWSGDPRSCYEGMAATLRGGLSLGMSGVPFWSHDIGGFYGNVSKDIFIRWAQFGLFSSHSRLHGTTTRQPWAYDEETKEIIRKFVRLRYSLMPYIWKTAKECTEEGLPFIRPLVLEYQEDENVKNIWDEYLFGGDILVAPVFGDHMAKRKVYFPDGEWEELLGEKRTFTGRKWYTLECPLDYLPCFKRKGTVVETEEVRMYVEGSK